MNLLDCALLSPAPELSPANAALASQIGAYAVDALRSEAELTPKPGLVDRRNNGAHRDMNLQSFLDSAQAIGGGFSQFVRAGVCNSALPARQVLPVVRPIGLLCEQAMFQATGGVNTHKGGIFALGLLCTAAGRLIGRGARLVYSDMCAEVAEICADLVASELQRANSARTAGERLFQCFGLTGARGEAASGYASARLLALPVLLRLTREGHERETALLQALLHLMAHGPADTNLVRRGGEDGLRFVRAAARDMLADGGVLHPDGRERMIMLDDALIARNLSPGGCADLLAVTEFLAHFA